MGWPRGTRRWKRGGDELVAAAEVGLAGDAASGAVSERSEDAAPGVNLLAGLRAEAQQLEVHAQVDLALDAAVPPVIGAAHARWKYAAGGTRSFHDLHRTQRGNATICACGRSRM
jgi:hypothetical protein